MDEVQKPIGSEGQFTLFSLIFLVFPRLHTRLALLPWRWRRRFFQNVGNALPGYVASHSTRESLESRAWHVGFSSSLVPYIGHRGLSLLWSLHFCAPLCVTFSQQRLWRTLSIGRRHHEVWSTRLTVTRSMGDVTGTVICRMCVTQARHIHDLSVVPLWSSQSQRLISKRFTSDSSCHVTCCLFFPAAAKLEQATVHVHGPVLPSLACGRRTVPVLIGT
jgi:hypothetical protein